MKQAVRVMEELAIPVEWGGHREETFLKQDLIVLSPGVDLAIEPIQRALKKGARIISEIELASPFHTRSDDCGDRNQWQDHHDAPDRRHAKSRREENGVGEM